MGRLQGDTELQRGSNGADAHFDMALIYVVRGWTGVYLL